MTRNYSAAALLVIAIIPAPLYAEPASHDLTALERDIAHFTGVQTGAPGGLARPLDARLRLAICPGAVDVRMGPMHDHLIIACAPRGWRFTVPLMPLGGTSVSGTVGGVPIRAWADQPAAVIRKGDQLRLLVPGDGFTINSTAIAQEDGQIGAAIRIRTHAKGPMLRAMVIDAATVSLQ